MEKLHKKEIMKEFDCKINSWIRERLIPLLAENESDAKFTVARPTGSFFISDLFFVTIHSAENGNTSVVVKLPLRNSDVKDVFDYDALFANEILFYNQIARIYDEDYPKCYLAGNDPTFNNAIVLEDVSLRGYTASPKKVDVEIDYIVAGLRSIARFHGHTYAVKEKEPTRFREIVRSIHEIRYSKIHVNKNFQNDINYGAQCLIRALRAKHYDSNFTATMSKLFEDAFTNVIMKCVKPMEPLATIIHGDCTINNMLYWKRNDGRLASMLIDFGLLTYSSPVIDVAIYFYLTCKREDIRDRSEELFSVYHDSLMEYMKEQGIWDSSKYSRQVFWQEYRQRAIFGFVGAALFFRYMMIVYERDNVMPEISDAMTEQFFDSAEGHDFLDLMIDMLDDLRSHGMLDHLIEISK